MCFQLSKIGKAGITANEEYVVRKMRVRVERFLLVTQSKDWIIKCDNRCSKKCYTGEGNSN
jgi:hypothetical protein